METMSKHMKDKKMTANGQPGISKGNMCLAIMLVFYRRLALWMVGEQWVFTLTSTRYSGESPIVSLWFNWWHMEGIGGMQGKWKTVWTIGLKGFRSAAPAGRYLLVAFLRDQMLGLLLFCFFIGDLEDEPECTSKSWGIISNFRKGFISLEREAKILLKGSLMGWSQGLLGMTRTSRMSLWDRITPYGSTGCRLAGWKGALQKKIWVSW